MIYIWVRRTLDWKDAALVEAQLLPDFRQKVAMWNASFEMPYHMFRQALKEIAQRNLERVLDAAIVPFEEVPPGALVVPVDDDDWFAPDLAEHLEAAREPGVVGYYWTRNMLEARPPGKWLKSWLREHRPVVLGANAKQGRHICGTNNYALECTSESREPAARHMLACEVFEAQHTRVKYLPMTLSLQNRNLSSQTSLAFRRPTVTRSEILAAFRRYRRLYARVRLAEGMAWAAPYIDEMADLTNSLKLSE